MSSLLSRGFGKVQDIATRLLYGTESVTTKMSFYDCVDKSMITGETIPMSSFAGDVLLVVNVASK